MFTSVLAVVYRFPFPAVLKTAHFGSSLLAPRVPHFSRDFARESLPSACRRVWGLRQSYLLLLSTSHPSNPGRQKPTALSTPWVLAICGIVNTALPT